MARGHGRILTSIWEDGDFKALDPAEQRLYLFLISQPNLNHAGLLDLTLRRWARKARGLTMAELEKTITALEDARFIVVDEDTEELLIRSFVRNDGVWRMPKVMGAMVSGALEISSKRLQAALLSEMDRIPLDELSDEPAKLRGGGEGPSIRQQVAIHIETLRRAFRDPNPDPTEGSSETPSGPPSGTPSDTPGEGGPKASTRGHAGPQVRAAPAPAPAPFPYPSPVKEGVAAQGEPTSTVAAAPQRSDDRPAPIDDDGFELNDGMRRWAHRDGYAAVVDIDYETAQFVSHHRAERTRKKSWPDEWQKWIRRSAKWEADRTPRALPVAAGAEGTVLHLPTGLRPSGTDRRVAEHAALIAQMEAEEQNR